MGFKKVKRKDSFAQWFLDTFGQDKFDNIILHEKNKEQGINIWEVGKRSSVQIWFQCENKEYHTFCVPADKYFIGNRCKYCGRTKYVHPKDSLGQYIIDKYGEEAIKEIWSDKNEKSPFKYSLGTEKKVWFKCHNKIHEDVLRQVKNAIASDLECPLCKRKVSRLESKVYSYLTSLNYTINREYNCTIVPKNPKTNFGLPFDNEIVELKTIVEVHGGQHYKKIGKTSPWLHGKSEEEFLYDRRLKDRYKKIYALSKGYEYIEIPYSCFDKKDSWKEIIDKNICEIKIKKGYND